MDIQKIAMQLINFLGNNPELISQFIQHPYSTTAQATGSDTNLSRTEMSEVVTAAAALSNNQQLPSNDIANIASALLGQNGNSVHALTNMLFGGSQAAQPQVQQAQPQAASSGSLDLGSLVNMATLASTLMSGASAAAQPQQAPKPSVDLSDGLNIGEIAMLASQFLGANGAKPQAAQQTQQAVKPQAQTSAVKPQAQQAAAPAQTTTSAPGIDFGTIAQLASILLSNRQ